MITLSIVGMEKNKEGTAQLPIQFSEPLRADLIKRAVEAINSHTRQPYASDPRAGKKASAKLSRRRRDYKGSYGHGISRVPRKTLSRNGTQMFWVGAFAPGMVGGRRAHPPDIEKIWSQKINDKERKKAIRSALSATLQRSIVEQRHHHIPAEYPFIISEKTEQVTKAKDIAALFEKLGFAAEFERTSHTKARSGKARLRGRGTKRPTGPLIVVSGSCPLQRAARNLAGVDVIDVRRLNAGILAPGAHPGRATLFTKKALDILEKERLFL